MKLPLRFGRSAPTRVFVRSTLARSLDAVGLLAAAKRLALRNRIVVLMYHRVLSDDAMLRTWSHPGIIVRSTTFESHMRLLCRHFRPLTLDEFIACVTQSRPFPRYSCLVTFDDGWLDTYTEAWPVLRHLGVPATVFLPVLFVAQGRMFWQEELREALFRVCEIAASAPQADTEAKALLDSHGCGHLLALPPDELREHIRARIDAKTHPEATSLRLLSALHQLLDEPSPRRGPDGFMSWDMVREMAAGGINFGAHGVTHRLLAALPHHEVREEVCVSRDDIVSELGIMPQAFAYPNGNWNARVAESVAACDFKVAFTTAPGVVSPDSDVWALPRLNVYQHAMPTSSAFLAHLVGLL